MIYGIFLSLNSECCLVWLLGVDSTPLLLASNFTCQSGLAVAVVFSAVFSLLTDAS